MDAAPGERGLHARLAVVLVVEHHDAEIRRLVRADDPERSEPEELGMRPVVARCHLGLGRLYRRAGQDAAAKEHLGIARTMLAQMEMRFWLEQAEAELTLTSGRTCSSRWPASS